MMLTALIVYVCVSCY